MTNYSDANVCGFTKINGTEKVVVMANLRNAVSNYIIPAALAGSYADAYTRAVVTLISGATQSLTAYQYRVLTNANVPTVPVTGVTLTPATVSVAAGLTTQLTATVVPANATNQAVTYTSSNTAVATVNASGLVTAVAAGTAIITVHTTDGAKTATSTITVTASSNFVVHFFKPSTWGTVIKIYWWSALPAGVLADGTWPGVNMVSEGTGWYNYTFTNITSTNLIFNDGTSQSADLNRNKTGWYLNGTWYDTNPGTPVLVTSVSVSPTAATVNAGATQQLTATVLPANATNKIVSWSSANTSVATVNTTGLVTAVAAGTTTITATTQDGNKTAACTITVPSAGGTTYYQIVNRWQPNTYLYDGGTGQVKYGTTPGTNTAYQWAKIDAGSGFVQLKNRSTGNYMHVENQTGAVQCGAITQSWYSAMWSIADAGSPYNYIENRWQPSDRINIEGLQGYAQYANTQPGWYSAMWQFVNPVVARTVTNAGTVNSMVVASLVPADKITEAAIYPNPATGISFFVALPSLQQNEKATITISDISGKKMQSGQLSESGKVQHHLPHGIYMVRIDTNRYSITKKLIIE